MALTGSGGIGAVALAGGVTGAEGRRRPGAKPAERRLTMVRLGQLDAAFVRAMVRARGVELIPLWGDFEPVLGRAFTNVQDTLAQIGTGAPCWTTLYAGAARHMVASGVAFRPLAGLDVPTCLAVTPGSRSVALRRLLDACATVR